MVTDDIFKKKRFTLIELMIAIAVITILISILLPSLQKAKRSAKMAVCKSNLSQVGKAGMLYAVGNNMRFPDRKSANANEWGAPFIVTRISGGSINEAQDDRELLRSLELDLTPCPFSPVEVTDWDNPNTSTSLLLTYSVYYGWNSASGVNLLSSLKPMIYQDKEFDILASDTLFDRPGKNYVASSHPDFTSNILEKHSKRPWWYSNVPTHGPLTLNYCRTDGSVFHLNDIKYRDDRLQRLPYKLGAANTSSGAVLLPDKSISE
jgi:prepilin-type N-terminal cleavage/methylation domain-containing protein